MTNDFTTALRIIPLLPPLAPKGVGYKPMAGPLLARDLAVGGVGLA